MTDKAFIQLCKDIVRNHVDEHLDKNDGISHYEVYIVWQYKELQIRKALVGTTLNDGMYYTLTLNEDKNEIQLDAYKSLEKRF